MLSMCLHFISLREMPRKEGLVASMEEQIDNNSIGEELDREKQEGLLCFFTVREASEGRMAGLPKTEASKSNKLFKLKEDLVVIEFSNLPF